MRDIYLEVNEKYLRPYVYGIGKAHLYPKVRLDLGNTKTLSKKTANEIVWTFQRSMRYLYPLAVSDSYPSYIRQKGSRKRYDVAIRVDGKWVTNRGNLVDKFSIMSLKAAKKITGNLQSFDYAIIKWYVDYVPMFLIRDDIVKSFNLEDILTWEYTPRDMFVANLIRELAVFDQSAN